MTRATQQARASAVPRTLEELTGRFTPLVIRSEREYREACGWIDELAILDRRTAGQERFLETLSLLVEAYEDEHHSIPPARLDPVDALRFLLDENSMSGRDLGRLLGDETLGGKILRRERELSKEHIRKLAIHFSVGPELFL